MFPGDCSVIDHSFHIGCAGIAAEGGAGAGLWPMLGLPTGEGDLRRALPELQQSPREVRCCSVEAHASPPLLSSYVSSTPHH